ncbi:MAG: SDR family oxidoreductase [Bacteroidota bacterium]
MNILVTGGAGFVGSNIVEALLNEEQVKNVKILDNLSTGSLKNLKDFFHHPKFEFVQGDIRDYDTCLRACEGVNRVIHQAALGSVPRSIKDPITTNEVNINGTLNVFNAAKECGVDRVIYAASSSTYGDSQGLPKVEDKIGNPLSPYAVTKLVNEQYAKVFGDLWDVDFIGLRYFNIFGPKQNPNGAYAAVIPLFFKAALRGDAPNINGDGSYSRDFTYVANAVQANLKALFTENEAALNQVYNVAVGERTTLNELWANIKEITGSKASATYGPNRAGDIPHSLASIDKAKNLLTYDPKYTVKDGLALACDWYQSVFAEEEVLA